jgi:hypothetical protein
VGTPNDRGADAPVSLEQLLEAARSCAALHYPGQILDRVVFVFGDGKRAAWSIPPVRLAGAPPPPGKP